MPTEVKEKPKTKKLPSMAAAIEKAAKVKDPPSIAVEDIKLKWSMNQDDYIELLKSIDTNAKAINNLTPDVKRIKTRLGL
jgi:hypothetical protein